MGDFLMNKKEVDRAFFLKKHQNNEITLKQVAKNLNLSYSQSKRLWKAYKESGEKGLISKARGKPSNRKFKSEFEEKIARIIETHYYDFKPTFANEKLKKYHNIFISTETLRKVMIKNGLWVPKQQKKMNIHQRRERREQYGELIQMDGSDHKWFEDRAPRCTLLVAVDDATSKLVSLRFEPSESLIGYFRLVENYFLRKGIPLAFYTDKAGIFRVNQGENRNKPTQFKRAMDELGITLICAHSPQAKGRVERANETLQDRLVKELRLRGISTIDEANTFLPLFIQEYNEAFGIEAKNSSNAHRPLDQNINLKHILCKKSQRKLSKNLELSFENIIYQIQEESWKNRLIGSQVTILELLDGNLVIEHEGRMLSYKRLEASFEQVKIVDFKEINYFFDKKLNEGKKSIYY